MLSLIKVILCGLDPSFQRFPRASNLLGDVSVNFCVDYLVWCVVVFACSSKSAPMCFILKRVGAVLCIVYIITWQRNHMVLFGFPWISLESSSSSKDWRLRCSWQKHIVQSYTFSDTRTHLARFFFHFFNILPSRPPSSTGGSKSCSILLRPCVIPEETKKFKLVLLGKLTK